MAEALPVQQPSQPTRLAWHPREAPLLRAGGQGFVSAAQSRGPSAEGGGAGGAAWADSGTSGSSSSFLMVAVVLEPEIPEVWRGITLDGLVL